MARTILSKQHIAVLCFAVMSLQSFAAASHLIEDIQEFKEIFVSISDSRASVNFYAVHLSSHSNTTVFQIKMRTCNGEVWMQAASSQHKLVNGDFDLPVLPRNYQTDQLLYVQKRNLETIYLRFALIEGYELNGQRESIVRLEMKALHFEDIQSLSFITYKGWYVRKQGAESGYFNIELDPPYSFSTFTPVGDPKGQRSLTAQFEVKMFAANDPVYAEVGLKCGARAIGYADYDVRGFAEEKYNVTIPNQCSKYGKPVCWTGIYLRPSTHHVYLAVGVKLKYDVIGEVDMMYGVVYFPGKTKSSGSTNANRTTFSPVCFVLFLFIVVIF